MSSSPGGSPCRHSDRGEGGARGSQIAADASSFRGHPPCDEEQHLGGTAEPTSAQTMQEQESSVAAASSSSPPAPEAGSHVTTEVVPPASGLPSTGSLFWAQRRNDWGLRFYIRVDLQGSFHTYPDLDGPFQSLQKAQNAIDRHLDARRVPKMCMEQAKVSVTEMAIRTCLYWPDGTRKKCSKSHAIEKDCDDKRRFVQALVDNYNKDHNLFGDIAYELKDVLHRQSIPENRMVYYHFNFTAKTKGADDFDTGTDNLFFAEVQSKRQGEHEELVVSCFCMVKPIDNGHCYGCTNYGSVDIKHPNEASAYTGGHLNICMTLTPRTDWSDEDEEAEEARIRYTYKGFKRFKKKLFSELPPDVKKRCLKITKSAPA